MSEKADLRNSIYDGMFANIFATLTGGVFLTGFALYLGMNELMIGLLASMPFMATVFQIPASYLIGKRKRKDVAYWAAALARTVWILVLLVTLMQTQSNTVKRLTILTLIFISYMLTSVSYVSWLSWMSDIIPARIRGRFFGTRNMLCGAAGLLVMLVFGKFLDRLNSQFYQGIPIGFGLIFISAVLFGIFSLHFLKKISEPRVKASTENMSFLENIALPLKESNFRKLLAFIFLWSFSVYFASPFFTLYFIRDLDFSYGFVATLGMLSGFADILGMQFWGRVSDKVRNKAIIRLASWVAAFLPLAWVTVKPENTFIPIFLHVVGGGFWAGINLCLNNLLLRITPKENRSWFISVYNIMGGLGATIGPILAGLTVKSISMLDFQLFSWKLMPLQLIFVISTFLRLFSLQLLKYVSEPEEVTIGKMVRILRSIRGLNMAAGFNFLLHPFVEIERDMGES